MRDTGNSTNTARALARTRASSAFILPHFHVFVKRFVGLLVDFGCFGSVSLILGIFWRLGAFWCVQWGVGNDTKTRFGSNFNEKTLGSLSFTRGYGRAAPTHGLRAPRGRLVVYLYQKNNKKIIKKNRDVVRP